MPLCEDGNAAAAVQELKSSLELDGEVPEVGSVTTRYGFLQLAETGVWELTEIQRGEI